MTGKGLENGPGLVATPHNGVLQIEFRPSQELEAALTLIASGVHPSHETMLESLIQRLIGVSQSPHTTVSLSVM
jgi:hypothetical protein